MALGHIVEHSGGDACKAGIVLDEAERVRAVDGAGVCALCLGDNDLDALLEQRVGFIRLNLLDGVGVVLQALDDQLAVRGREKLRRGLRVFNMAGHIPDTFGSIERGGEEVVIRIIVGDKLDLGEVAAAG